MSGGTDIICQVAKSYPTLHTGHLCMYWPSKTHSKKGVAHAARAFGECAALLLRDGKIDFWDMF